jgi:hypothetical protein
MKKSDIAMIILIAAVSMMLAYFGAQAILGDAQNESVQVKTIERISTEVTEPDPSVFNSNAINPTVEVIIGGDQSNDSDQGLQ